MQTGSQFLTHFFGKRIVGIDEAGRGPLAGPLCVAGVILPQDHEIVGLNDSKLLSKTERERLYSEILKVGEVFFEKSSAKRIDTHGILVETKRLMRKIALKSQASWVLTDAVSLNLRDVPQLALTKGDQKIDAIAAASIVAKVKRDNILLNLAKKYPGYGFEKHKGYGTAYHREAIKTHGLSAEHRKTFCKAFC